MLLLIHSNPLVLYFEDDDLTLDILGIYSYLHFSFMRKLQAVSDHLDENLVHPGLISLDDFWQRRVQGDLEFYILGRRVCDEYLANFVDRLL